MWNDTDFKEINKGATNPAMRLVRKTGYVSDYLQILDSWSFVAPVHNI